MSKPKTKQVAPPLDSEHSAIRILALANSTPATSEEEKQDAIYRCAVAAFDKEGLNHISSPDMKVVWSLIDGPIVTSLGDDIRSCLTAKGYQVSDLATVFAVLKSENRVTLVRDLVVIIGTLTGRPQ